MCIRDSTCTVFVTYVGTVLLFDAFTSALLYFHTKQENWNWSWTVAGLGNAIPNKLREIHMLLLEDDVPAPDELVRRPNRKVPQRAAITISFKQQNYTISPEVFNL